jgi:altronate dehydratase small subunit
LNPDKTPTPARTETSLRAHRIHQRDNVAVALVDMAALARVSVGETNLLLRQAVPFGHKLALVDIKQGLPVIKYGEQIGLATHDIAAGEHVHVHNVESTRGRGDLATAPDHAVV